MNIPIQVEYHLILIFFNSYFLYISKNKNKKGYY